MTLTLTRTAKKTDYTVGRLEIDGEYFCDTLEDTDRGLTSDMPAEEIAAVKVAGATAIPAGEYRVTLDIVSPKFSTRGQYAFCGGKLPRLLGVPGFDGVLIHIGNTADDTAGCVLVGWNTAKGRVLGSTAVFKELYSRMKQAAGEMSIKIR